MQRLYGFSFKRYRNDGMVAATRKNSTWRFWIFTRKVLDQR